MPKPVVPAVVTLTDGVLAELVVDQGELVALIEHHHRSPGGRALRVEYLRRMHAELERVSEPLPTGTDPLPPVYCRGCSAQLTLFEGVWVHLVETVDTCIPIPVTFPVTTTPTATEKLK